MTKIAFSMTCNFVTKQALATKLTILVDNVTVISVVKPELSTLYIARDIASRTWSQCLGTIFSITNRYNF